MCPDRELYTIPDSQGQVSSNKLSYRVYFIIGNGYSNEFKYELNMCPCTGEGVIFVKVLRIQVSKQSFFHSHTVVICILD